MILLTGATGYIGQKILSFLDSDDEVLLPIRKKGGIDPNERVTLPESRRKQNTIIVESDLNGLVLDQSILNRIEVIIHNAAVTAFNVDELTANRDNIESSKKIFEIGANCPNLKKLIYVSTVYTSGMTTGKIEEVEFKNKSGGPPEFANHYERSKWEAENMLMNEYSNLPWVIARVATVISDDNSGKVVQQNAVHNTLKLFYYGLISLLPGNKETPIYLVTGEFVKNALRAIYKSEEIRKIYHVCHSRNEVLRLGKLIDITYDVFLRDSSFSGKRILKPLFTDMGSFNTLVDNVNHFGGAILSQGVSSVAPFGKQLFVDKDIENKNLRHLLKDQYPTLSMEEIVDKSCEYLVANKFTTK